MSPPSLSQRFKRNPWPWLIGVLLLILTLMWVRERKLHQYELKKSHQFHPQSGFFAGLKIPPFIDPFGNIYQLQGNISAMISEGNDTGDLWLIIENYASDGSPHRVILLSRKRCHFGGPPTMRDIPPIVFSSLLLTFSYLWLRNVRQRRIQQP